MTRATRAVGVLLVNAKGATSPWVPALIAVGVIAAFVALGYLID